MGLVFSLLSQLLKKKSSLLISSECKTKTKLVLQFSITKITKALSLLQKMNLESKLLEGLLSSFLFYQRFFQMSMPLFDLLKSFRGMLLVETLFAA